MNDKDTYSSPAEIRHTIGAGGHLTIQAIAGSVTLRGTDSDEAVVVVRSESGGGELPLTVQRSDGGLHIEVAKHGLVGFGAWFGRDDGSLEFEAVLPRGARVDLKTVSSDIGTKLLTGDQSYKTVSGDVEIDQAGGRIQAATVSGDVDVRAAQPVELSANSTSGDVRVRGAVLASFNARTVSGDVEFEAGLATGAVHSVETVSGDLSVESTTGVTVDVKRSMDIARGRSAALVAGDGAASLRFRTLSGDCHVAGARHDERGHSAKRKGFRVELPEMPPMPKMPPMPPTFATADAAPPPPDRPEIDQLEVLRALERGEIDVDEATRRLQEA